MSERSLRGKVAVVGIGETTYYKRAQAPDPEFKLGLQAVLAAAQDAGIDQGFLDYGKTQTRRIKEGVATGDREEGAPTPSTIEVCYSGRICDACQVGLASEEMVTEM